MGKLLKTGQCGRNIRSKDKGIERSGWEIREKIDRLRVLQTIEKGFQGLWPYRSCIMLASLCFGYQRKINDLSTWHRFFFFISFALIIFLKNTCLSYYACVLSHVQLFVTRWTVALQAPLSIGFSRPFPLPGDLPDPGIEPTSPMLAGRFFTTRSTWEALIIIQIIFKLTLIFWKWNGLIKIFF